METLNTLKQKLDLTTLIGLTFVTIFIVPTVIFVVQEIINGSFNNW